MGPLNKSKLCGPCSFYPFFYLTLTSLENPSILVYVNRELKEIGHRVIDPSSMACLESLIQSIYEVSLKAYASNQAGQWPLINFCFGLDEEAWKSVKNSNVSCIGNFLLLLHFRKCSSALALLGSLNKLIQLKFHVQFSYPPPVFWWLPYCTSVLLSLLVKKEVELHAYLTFWLFVVFAVVPSPHLLNCFSNLKYPSGEFSL